MFSCKTDGSDRVLISFPFSKQIFSIVVIREYNIMRKTSDASHTQNARNIRDQCVCSVLLIPVVGVVEYRCESAHIPIDFIRANVRMMLACAIWIEYSRVVVTPVLQQ